MIAQTYLLNRNNQFALFLSIYTEKFIDSANIPFA